VGLTGTKVGCNEGGCGACTVVVGEWNETKAVYKSVNACLFPACAAHLKHVITVEGARLLCEPRTQHRCAGLTSSTGAPHVIQTRLARAHGSQCGFCTPGFVMAMYGVLRENRRPTKTQIDRAMQGNLCRCTGYRPILQAFYSFADENVSGAPLCRRDPF